MKSVPDKWLDYKPYGNVIKGTKILPFKVPLKERKLLFNRDSQTCSTCPNSEATANKVTPEQRFTPTILLKAFPRLKCIVDLTNTDRYYEKEEFTNAGVKYKKIMVPGQRLPPLWCVMQFFEVMHEFMTAANEDDIIGVHCTHGINRSGYLICRYLIQQQGWEVKETLKAFEEARGYSIERSTYVASLNDLPRGKKIDASKVIASESSNLTGPMTTRRSSATSRPAAHQRLRKTPHPMGPPPPGFVPPGFVPPGFIPPGFPPPRRGFANRAPYPPQPFGFGAPPPGFGSMPPHPPGMPLPPPPGPPTSYRFGPPPPPLPPPAMRVSGPGFHPPGFPLRLPGPPRMAGPPRLPPGPPARLPPPKMPPPPPPPRSQSRQPVTTKRIQGQKKKQQQQMRNGIAILPKTSLRLARREVGHGARLGRSTVKILKEQDFTVDTFEENLLAVATTNAQLRRPPKGRYNQAK